MGKNTEVFDNDINPILEIASNDDLDFLVELVTRTYTNFLCRTDVYKEHFPDHKKYADLLAKEICEYGGNSFSNIFRGSGPTYKEIVCNAATKLGVPFNSKQPIEFIENSILSQILTKALENMSDDEKHDLLKNMNVKDYSLIGPTLTITLIKIFNMGGFKSYQISVIIANQIAKAILGHGLKLAANVTLTRLLSILTGPVGWTIASLWTAIDLAGPAYRVTVPSIIYIAMLRKKYTGHMCSNCKNIVAPGTKFCPECGNSTSKLKNYF